MKANLEVHHILYRSQGGGHDQENLITLCNTCHGRAHSNKKRYQPILLEAQRLHYQEGFSAIGVITTAKRMGIDMKQPRR